MIIKPLNSNVLIKPEEEKISETIITLDDDKKTPEKGEVLAIGEEVENVKVGDKVIFIKYSPNEVTVEEEEYMIINEDDIIATI